MLMFSIKNEKLGFFNRPIFANSVNEALSLIQNILMSDSDRALSGLKSDLALYKVGEFDQVHGFLRFADANEKDYNLDVGLPILICSLEDIFNSIPEESLKPSITREDHLKLVDEIDKVGKKLVELSVKFDNHSHIHKKGVVKIESHT